MVKLAPINISKRKEAEKLLYDMLDAADPSGKNRKKYEKIFGEMSNEKFKSFMCEMWDDDTLNFVLDIVDYEHDLSMKQIEKAAKVINVPLEEDIVYPFINMDKEKPIMGKYNVITGYLILKRMQQTTLKKNSTSIHISERSATTGQVVGHDKNGRSSDQENIALVAIGAENIAKEFNGFRADGLQRKNQAYASIATSGYCSMEDLDAGIDDRTVLNTIDVYFLGMGIKTDLISNDLLLPSTARNIKKQKGDK